jgi:LmbE family N-acetylglucosaminyl deacetylase
MLRACPVGSLQRVTSPARTLVLRGLRAARRWLDSRHRSAVRADPAGPAVILSPHVDDAVLSCWSVLTGPGDVRVVNVFAGVPRAGTLANWDRIMGATDSAARMRERFDEDREALALAGRDPALHLPFADSQYRGGRPPAALSELESVLPKLSAVYAPACTGVAHPDHLHVRRLAEALARAGVPAFLYADLPYCAEFGWPAWVTGADSDPHLDVDAIWAAPAGEPAVVRLDDAQAAAKHEAIKAYATQYAALARGPVGLISNPEIHRYEVFWRLPER